jgi:mannan endo-1,4-beta-mannosidase
MPTTLSKGLEGDGVLFLHQVLNTRPTALSLLVEKTSFDADTTARVEEFQADGGLVIDGVVGPVTWGALLGRQVVETGGFCVLGRHLYDALGTRVILRGINKMSVFDANDPDGSISFPEIKRTGANTVRIVWAIATNLQPGGPATSVSVLDALVAKAKANQLIPMAELHDATGDWSRLTDLVQYWTDPAVVAILQKHGPCLLINIGNEVGDDSVSEADFVLGYTAAVTQIRAAGVRSPLVIDATDWGKDLSRLNSVAATPLGNDPEGNLMFSVHMYWSKSCGADALSIRSNLEQAVALDYPLVIGEFSRYGGYPCGDPAGSMCGPAGEIDYTAIISAAYDLDLGWYAWEWGPGNDYFDKLFFVMDMTSDSTFASLKPGWPTEVALTSPFSIQNTTITPPSML